MHTLFLILLVIISVLGIVGNLLIVFTVAFVKRLRIRTNVFSVNLAVADLLVTTYVMPVGMGAWMKHGGIFESRACSVNAFLLLTSCVVSIQSLMMVAIERYVHICHYTHYEGWFRPRAVAGYVAVSWLYGGAWAAQGFTGWTRFVYGEHTYVCSFDEGYRLSYDISFVVFAIILPMIILAFCYVGIFRRVASCGEQLARHSRAKTSSSAPQSLAAAALSHNQQQRLRRVRRELTIVVTLFTIFIAFFVCWTPNVIVFLSAAIWSGLPSELRTIAMWLAFSNSSVNSILYGVLNRNFRLGYISLFRMLFCSRKSTPKQRGAGGEVDKRVQKDPSKPIVSSSPVNTEDRMFQTPPESPLSSFATLLDSPIDGTPERSPIVYKTVIQVAGSKEC